MSILGKLISELKGEKPTPTPSAEVDIQPEAKRTWKKPNQSPQAVGAIAHSEPDEEGLIRLRRVPPLPDVVRLLDWGGPVPLYVDYCDGVYRLEGSRDRPSYALVEWIKPPWLQFDATCSAPSMEDCCVQCGRRLFWRSDIGEFCACCYAPTLSLMIRIHVAEPSDTYTEALQRISFFLKPGIGLDW